MSRSVIFKTKGHIPIEAFTTFGVNSKPSTTNPIGFFGSGLKYAVSVLLQHKCDVSVWIGMTEHKFRSLNEDFRGKEFQWIYMHPVAHVWRERVLEKIFDRAIRLPFTTELGKTWKLWQAYRELHSNTLDENGEIFVGEPITVDDVKNKPFETHIVVTGEQFVQEYWERHKTFLPEGLRVRNSSDRLQVLDKPGGAIYYRGIRVVDLEGDRKSKFTYNILQQMELTEDRTLKDVHEAERIIADHISQSEDKKLISKALDGKPSLESNLPYDWGYQRPSDTFSNYSSRDHAPSRARTLVGYFRAPSPPVNWKKILETYMRLVVAEEGTNFLGTFQTQCSPDEFRHLVDIALEIDPNDAHLHKIREDLGGNENTSPTGSALAQPQNPNPVNVLHPPSLDDEIPF